MELKMVVDGRLIETVKINSLQVKTSNYLDQLKSDLSRKHFGLIETLQKQPTFYVEVSCNEGR